MSILITERIKTTGDYWKPKYLKFLDLEDKIPQFEVYCLFGYLNTLAKDWILEGKPYNEERCLEIGEELQSIRNEKYPRNQKDRFGRVLPLKDQSSPLLTGIGARILEVAFELSIDQEV